MAVVPAGAGAFSDLEEEFFRAGVTLEAASLVESFEDLDDGYQPQSWWSRVIHGRPQRAPTEPPLMVLPPPMAATRASTRSIVVEDDEEWEWQIAIARARLAIENEL